MAAEVMEAPEVTHRQHRSMDTPKEIAIGLCLKAMRKKRNMNLADLEQEAKIEEGSLHLMEIGSRKIFPAVLQRLATALKCKPHELDASLPKPSN